MHPCIQVKTKLLPEQASCLPGKPSVRMCVSTEPRGRHSIHKARADETDETMSEHASFHAWLCSHKREKDSSNYRELRLLHWLPPVASCKGPYPRVSATKNTCSAGSYAFFNTTTQAPRLCSARTQHSASGCTAPMQHTDSVETYRAGEQQRQPMRRRHRPSPAHALWGTGCRQHWAGC